MLTHAKQQKVVHALKSQQQQNQNQRTLTVFNVFVFLSSLQCFCFLMDFSCSVNGAKDAFKFWETGNYHNQPSITRDSTCHQSLEKNLSRTS